VYKDNTIFYYIFHSHILGQQDKNSSHFEILVYTNVNVSLYIAEAALNIEKRSCG